MGYEEEDEEEEEGFVNMAERECGHRNDEGRTTLMIRGWKLRKNVGHRCTTSTNGEESEEDQGDEGSNTS